MIYFKFDKDEVERKIFQRYIVHHLDTADGVEKSTLFVMYLMMDKIEKYIYLWNEIRSKINVKNNF